jgi:glycosyltransferase involved in cell wall biosynthesis
MRVLYLYRSARRAGGPSEFAYGAPELAALGYAVDTLDATRIARLAGAADPRAPAPGAWARLTAAVAPYLAPALPAVSIGHFATPAVARELAKYDAIVATTTGLGIAAAAAKRRGAFPGRLVCLAMGILADDLPAFERGYFAKLFRYATLATLSQAEARFLRARLGPACDVVEAGFGVDTSFWTPDPSVPRGGFALAVGNDRMRDWPTLIAAWRPEFPRLRLLTRAALPPLPANVERIEGSLDAPAIDDAGLRDLYRRAACVVVPLKPTIQPSGQSVTLQAMACGAPLVLSRVAGLWDSALAEDGALCRGAPGGDANALDAALGAVFADPAASVAMGARAAAHTRAHASIEAMAARLDRILRRQAA